MVQLDFDEELGPLHGMYGSMDAELEVQRTIKRTELTAFLCLLKRVIGPVRVQVDKKELVEVDHVHQEDGADGLLMPLEKSDWASQGPS